MFKVFAFTTAFNLLLIAGRDFLGHQALMLLYVTVAGNLSDMEQAYVQGQVPFGGNNLRRLAQMVRRAEQRLGGGYFRGFLVSAFFLGLRAGDGATFLA